MSSGDRTPATPPRRIARECLLVNVLVFPGLGSVLAGRRIGWLQGALTLIGCVFTVVWFIDFTVAWWRTRLFPADGGGRLGLGLVGVGLFVIGWSWGLATGLDVRRQAHHAIPPHLG